MNRQRLLERFLRYVQIDTTACDGAASVPSSPGQLVLGRILVEELATAGIADARQDEHGVVLATVPGNVSEPCPVIAFCAHVDTSPEAPGANVKPQVIASYHGGDLTLPGDSRQVIRVADNPELETLIGQTLITSDGTTLLGADDKAGVAVIMETAAWLGEHPELPHGPLRLCFTCDEEIGHGTDHLRPAQVGATVCYTLDGDSADKISVETFSADLAVVTVRGKNIHPSIGKGRMTNAIRAAAEFVARLPRDRLSPETTADREGFLHPYQIQGGVGEVELRVILRDFDTSALAVYADRLRETAAAVKADFPAAEIEVAISKQYRNMAEGLALEPRAGAYAEEALRRLGRTPKCEIIRGGTDGARLTELGLPTPNLSTGQHTPHSLLEWACLDEMVAAGQWLVAIAERWSEAAKG